MLRIQPFVDDPLHIRNAVFPLLCQVGHLLFLLQKFAKIASSMLFPVFLLHVRE